MGVKLRTRRRAPDEADEARGDGQKRRTRLLTGDDADQTKRAVALFTKETIFIPKTVLLETEWVLRRLYRLDRKVVVSACRKLSGLGKPL